MLVLLMMGLAAYRLTRLVTRDSIGDRPREQWFDWFPPSAERGKVTVDWSQWRYRPAGGAYMHPRAQPKPLSMLGQWADCAFCAGVTISGLVVLAAVGLGHLPWRWQTVEWWPVVAGGQGLLSALDGKLTA